MKRELDEIEAEMGKESMEYKCGFWPSTFGAGVLCGRVILCPMIPRSTCPHRGPIPVEPERVKGCVRPAYFSHCDYGKASAMCYTCGFWQPLPFPSPGLLQRMGMCVWEEEMGIIDALVVIQCGIATEAQRHQCNRAWSVIRKHRDGVQG
jgi:hypothetical protein